MSPTTTMLIIIAAMVLIAAIESLAPLHHRDGWGKAHVLPNLTLTAVTFVTSTLLGIPIIWLLGFEQQHGLGLFRLLPLSSLAETVLALVVLDFSFWLTHVVMHKFPALWRFHAVHHSDPEVDVTTTIRQHPGESLIRYAFLGVFSIALGVSPAVFALYRAASALNGLLEHANITMPLWLDRALSWVTTWPHFHKIHHARDVAYTDTNYGNLLSLWDRMFGTFTPSHAGIEVASGLDGFDEPEMQSTLGLFRMPFRIDDHEASARSFPGASTLSTEVMRPSSSRRS